jgi:hypothetical protein
MSLTTRQGKGSKLTIQEMDNNLLYLEGQEISNTYPVTTPVKAGQKFFYKGSEWHYMTQEQIDSAGWTSLVSVGFPAPVRKILDSQLFGNYTTTYYSSNQLILTEINFLGLGMPNNINMVNALYSFDNSSVVTTIRNANMLTNLEDLGTTTALYLFDIGLTEEVINDLFTQLPITAKNVTVNVRDNPGSATCDTSIATGKGYTVVV